MGESSSTVAVAMRQKEHPSVPENADCEGRSAACRDAAGGRMAENDPAPNLGGAAECRICLEARAKLARTLLRAFVRARSLAGYDGTPRQYVVASTS